MIAADGPRFLFIIHVVVVDVVLNTPALTKVGFFGICFSCCSLVHNRFYEWFRVVVKKRVKLKRQRDKEVKRGGKEELKRR